MSWTILYRVGAVMDRFCTQSWSLLRGVGSSIHDYTYTVNGAVSFVVTVSQFKRGSHVVCLKRVCVCVCVCRSVSECGFSINTLQMQVCLVLLN